MSLRRSEVDKASRRAAYCLEHQPSGGENRSSSVAACMMKPGWNYFLTRFLPGHDQPWLQLVEIARDAISNLSKFPAS